MSNKCFHDTFPLDNCSHPYCDEIARLREELASEKRCHGIAKSYNALAIADRNIADHNLGQAEARAEAAEAALAKSERIADGMRKAYRHYRGKYLATRSPAKGSEFRVELVDDYSTDERMVLTKEELIGLLNERDATIEDIARMTMLTDGEHGSVNEIIAAKDAEIERLRGDVERLKGMFADSNHDRNLAKARAEAAEAERDDQARALISIVDGHSFGHAEYFDACGENWETIDKARKGTRSPAKGEE